MKNKVDINIKKIFCIICAVYIGLIFLFYFLAGDQLRYRESRGTIEMPVPDAGTAELCTGSFVEQFFSTRINRLSSVSVQVGNYSRQNSGTITMTLLRVADGAVLLQQQFDASGITDGQILTMTTEVPLEGLYDVPLALLLTADSVAGNGVIPLMASNLQIEQSKYMTPDTFSLMINGEQVAGRLSFAAAGTDYIWTGLHYWQLAVLLGVVLVAILLIVWIRYRNGKRSFLVNSVFAVRKYRFLINQLVSRDFKKKYQRSVLGVFWSFLNPLLMMIVQYIVFSTVFKSDVPYFAAYLIIGTVMFNFFSESVGMSLTSILENGGLITKVYMPKYIYPLTRVLSSVINLAISLIPMLIVCLVNGVHFKKSVFLALFFFLCLIIFCLGLGMLLATSMVFFRDTQFLWGVLSMIWMYATPIFYPETIIPDDLQFILQINPMYYFLKNTRLCILDGISPEPAAYFSCLLIALVMLFIGACVFYKKQDQFVLCL